MDVHPLLERVVQLPSWKQQAPLGQVTAAQVLKLPW
jgi:hypothetical protein